MSSQVSEKRTVLVAPAWPYANGPRHIGHVAGLAVPGDVIARFERLRAMRTRLAREKEVPAYVICHDSVLKQIASRPPASLMELGRIRGMGPAKINQFGEAILTALRESE